jgi:DNA-binding MarR family transcriptional regulator
VDDDERRLDALSGVFLLAKEMRHHLVQLMADEDWAVDAGFRPPCMGVMAVVAHRQPVSQREISDELGLDASDVVGVLDVLEAANLVLRQRDPLDRRRHAVVLTEAGEAAHRRLSAVRAEAEARALADLDDDERRILAELLQRANAGREAPVRERGAHR